MTQKCADPVLIPDRDLPQPEVEALWGGDRSALITCGEKLGVLQDYYLDRDGRLRDEQ